jgi:hypothetical protein
LNIKTDIRQSTHIQQNPAIYFYIFRLSFLVSDLQQAMLSSRRQSMFPLVPPRPTSPYLSPFHWHQNSSASQPIRRPSEAYQPIIARRGTVPYNQNNRNRRFSCDHRLTRSGHNVPGRRASLTLRRSSFQSDKRDEIIQEVKETPSPVQSKQPTFDHDYQNIESSNLPENLPDNYIRHCSFSCLRGGIHSSSSRFSDV